MSQTHNVFTRLIAMALALLLLGSTFSAVLAEELAVLPLEQQIPEPLQLSDTELARIYSVLGLDVALMANQGSIPDEMWSNDVLDSLSYLGYNVDQQKEDGKLYDAFYTTQYDYANNAYGSGIPYDSAGASTGYETVTDATTKTGKAPNVAKWQSKGLCCASFATYYLLNYLPNIKGTNAELASALHTAITTNGRYHNLQSPYAWYYGLEKMIKDGTTIGGEKVKKYTSDQRALALEDLKTGDVIIFTGTNATTGATEMKHVAIFIGENEGKYWIANVSNAKGPGLDLLTVYENYYTNSKGGEPIYYSLPLVEEEGYIAINKTDENGSPLAGAYFLAVDNVTGEDYTIGPTDSNGYAISQKLKMSNYTVTETVVPNGYKVGSTNSWTFDLTAELVNLTYTLNVTNYFRYGQAAVKKTDDAGTPLANVPFGIYSDAGCTKQVGNLIYTNSQGIAMSGNLEEGTYYIREYAPLHGHVHNTTVYPVTVEGGQVRYANSGNPVINVRMGQISVTKTDDAGSRLGAGYQFGIYSNSACTVLVETITTNSNSVATTSLLAPGQYYIKELALAPGDTTHVLNANVYPAVITSAQTTPTVIENALTRGTIGVIKADDAGNRLSGVAFGVYSNAACTSLVSTITTDTNGVATLGNLRHGDTYYLREMAAKEGYVYNGTVYPVTVLGKSTTYCNGGNPVVNTRMGKIQATKTDKNGTVAAAGYVFNIYSDAACTVLATQITSNGTGTAVSGWLNPNVTYYLKEASLAPGDQLHEINPNVYPIYVDPGQTETISLYNEYKKGYAGVYKTDDAGVPMAGVTFGVFYDIDCTQAACAPIVTNEQGIAVTAEQLDIGTYYIQELSTHDTHVMDTNVYDVVVTAGVTSYCNDGNPVINMRKFWQLTVQKMDSMNGSLTSGDASIVGAVYGLYNADDLLLGRFAIGADGKFTTDAYLCGTGFYLKEIAAPTGYKLDPSTYLLDAYTDPAVLVDALTVSTMNITEDVKTGSIFILKHADISSSQIETPEPGAEFEIYLKAAGSYAAADPACRDLLITDENGYAQSKDLPYGLYTVHQVKGWEWTEICEDFDVFISEDGQVYHFILNNTPFTAYVKVSKTDSETGKLIPCAGTGFHIFDPDGNQVKMTITYPQITVIDTFYTTADGTLITPTFLIYGEGYTLVEVAAPEGYVLDLTPVRFDVVKDHASEESGIIVVNVEKKNDPQKGTITVSKEGEIFASVTESNGLYQPEYKVAPLAGAEFSITAAEDIYTPDGTLRYRKGEVVDTLITGAGGSATSKLLYLGKYEIREATAPAGMVLCDTVKAVELTYAGQNVQVTTASAQFQNERQKAVIRLSKALELDDRFNIGANGEIQNIRFALYAAEALTAANGSEIPADGLLEVAACDKNGSIIFSTDLPVGARVYVKEYNADPHYIPSNEVYPLVFEYAGQDMETVTLSVNNGAAIENRIIRGSVVGKKLDEDGFAICDTLFGLFRESETEFTEQNARAVVKSNEIGIFVFDDVPYGRWIIREIAAAPAFVLSENRFAVTITNDGEVVEIVIENEFITGTVQAIKVDSENPSTKLAGSIFEIYVDVDCNKMFDAEIDLLVGTMTETDTGVHTMSDLRYNGYFLHEKTAPEGFLQDNGYCYFEIRNDGETVTVENKAGVGFVNDPMIGELELSKIDVADGKPLPGVGIRIRNSAGEIIHEGRTDENGVVRFSLRVGKYTYQEFDPLGGYLLDETEYAFEITEHGHTVKVELTNEKIPVIDVPDTDDGMNLISLSFTALISLIAVPVLIALRKRAAYKQRS